MSKFGTKRALIVSYNFPPVNSIGTVRIYKFAKYLQDFGWETHILTSQPYHGRPLDSEFQFEEDKITRTKAWDLINDLREISGYSQSYLYPQKRKKGKFSPYGMEKWMQDQLHAISLILFPDQSFGWYPFAVKAGRKLLQKKSFDLIFSSCLPFTANRIASRLHAISGLPWVADYRDIWINNYTNRYSALQEKILQRFEREVNKNVSCFTTVSEPFAKSLETLHKDKIAYVVSNGFDPLDYRFINKVVFPGCFSVTYTGSIYRGKRDPTPFFEAVARLQVKGVINPETFSIHFYGPGMDGVKEISAACGIGEFVHIHGYVPYLESLKAQTSATLLLMLPCVDETQKGWLSGKIYEYLGSGRPILSVGPEDGSVEHLLQETGGGVSLKRTADIEAMLQELVGEFSQTKEILSLCSKRKNAIIQQYSRQLQTQKLAAIFDQVVKRT